MRKGTHQLPLFGSIVAVSAALTVAACGAASATNVGPGTGSTASPPPTSTASSAPTGTPSPTLDLTTLTKIAKNGIASEGGKDVTAAGAVLTTQNKATLGSIPSDQAVYLIQLKGHFTAYGASLSQGSKGYPTGIYLTMVAQASNGQVVDWGVGDRGIDLASLGTVIQLPL